MIFYTKDPIPNIKAHPSTDDITKWYFVIVGEKNTEYEGGVYMGKVLFPYNYPFKPPKILFITPSGRATPN